MSTENDITTLSPGEVRAYTQAVREGRVEEFWRDRRKAQADAIAADAVLADAEEVEE